MNRIVRNMSFNTASLIVTFVAGIITSAVSARTLGPEALGLFSFAMWLFLTLAQVFDTGAANATMKFVSELEGAQQHEIGNKLTLNLIIFQGCIGLIISMALIIFNIPLVSLFGNAMTSSYLIVVATAIPLYMTYLVVHGRLSGFQRYDLISVIQIGAALINLIGTIVVLNLGGGVWDLLLMNASIYLVQLIACIVFIWRTCPLLPTFPLPKVLNKRVISYCIGFFVITCFDAVIWQRSETYFLGRYSTTEQVAYYGLAYNLSRVLVSMLPSVFTQILIPYFSRSFGAGDRSSMQRAYEVAIKYVGFIVLPLCLFTVALANSLVLSLYGPQYQEVIIVLQIMLVASLMYAIIAPSSGLFFALGKPYLAVIWLAPIALLNLLFAYLVVPDYGAVGAALVKTVCQTLAVTASVVYLIKFQGFHYPFLVVSKTLAAALIGAVIIYVVAQQGTLWLTLVIGVPGGTVAYIAILASLRALDAFDYEILGMMLNRIAPLLRRQYQ